MVQIPLHTPVQSRVFRNTRGNQQKGGVRECGSFCACERVMFVFVCVCVRGWRAFFCRTLIHSQKRMAKFDRRVRNPSLESCPEKILSVVSVPFKTPSSAWDPTSL
jgi:hypothetical protein